MWPNQKRETIDERLDHILTLRKQIYQCGYGSVAIKLLPLPMPFLNRIKERYCSWTREQIGKSLFVIFSIFFRMKLIRHKYFGRRFRTSFINTEFCWILCILMEITSFECILLRHIFENVHSTLFKLTYALSLYVKLHIKR